MTYKPNPNYGRPSKATLPSENTLNAQYPDKPVFAGFKVVALHKGKFVEPVTVKFFASASRSASMVYCSIWTHNNATGRTFNGHGKAGGYGYHKASAAFAEAMESAGIRVNEAVSGVGDSAVQYAIGAIVKALGYRKFHIVSF